MSLGPFFTSYRPPTVIPHSDPNPAQKWLVFRIREQMYTMAYYGPLRGFRLEKVPEDLEASFDEWCNHPELKDPRFTYIRLTPHPTDDVMQDLIRHGTCRGSIDDWMERRFLKDHGAAHVLEEIL